MARAKVSKSKITKIKLTRFEKARLIGARALQLSMGAKPLIKVSGTLDPIDIATMELKEGIMPLKVRDS